MPRGIYHRLDEAGATSLVESFHSAAGPSGWRYVAALSTVDGNDAGSVDVAVDERGRALRVTLRLGEWQLRGGLTGRELLWVRRPAAVEGDVTEHRQTATGFIGGSPAFLIAAAMAVDVGAEPTVQHVVELTALLGARLAVHRWQRTAQSIHQGESGSLTVETFRYADLATGAHTDVHVAGDVVLDAPGLALIKLDAPPGRR